MTGIQLITIAVALLMLFITYTALRRHELRMYEYGIWTVIWLGLLFVSVFPDVLRGIIGPLHVVRLLDLVTIVGLLVIGVLVFSFNRALRQLENRVATIVRRRALDSPIPDEPAEAPPSEREGPLAAEPVPSSPAPVDQRNKLPSERAAEQPG